MNILIGMETSGAIREAFRAKGHNAWSCDLLPSDDNSTYHHQCDIYDVLDLHRWDIIVMHPECTKLCISGNHVYAGGKPKYEDRKAAVLSVDNLWAKCISICDRVCFENPVGVLSTMSNLPKPQYIQPHKFGEDASKKTGLFLHGLPELRSTDRITGRLVVYNGRQYERWANQTDSGQNNLPESKGRWKLRSKTFPGIAKAMAEQWG